MSDLLIFEFWEIKVKFGKSIADRIKKLSINYLIATLD